MNTDFIKAIAYNALRQITLYMSVTVLTILRIFKVGVFE